MTTAIVSALTGIPVRADVAMTGEITLRGEVTAIGGLKEKLLAALRGGIKTVLIPEENAKDLQDIPENVKHGLEIVPVKWIDKVLEVALERQPTPLTDDEVQVAAPAIDPARVPPEAGHPADVHQALSFFGCHRGPKFFCYIIAVLRGSSSVGRAQPCQG
jgi:ATP-dependent Lon protease